MLVLRDEHAVSEARGREAAVVGWCLVAGYCARWSGDEVVPLWLQDVAAALDARVGADAVAVVFRLEKGHAGCPARRGRGRRGEVMVVVVVRLQEGNVRDLELHGEKLDAEVAGVDVLLLGGHAVMLAWIVGVGMLPCKYTTT